MKFVSKDQGFLDSLHGLPLSFRQSESLHWFSSSETVPKPIISKFGHLLSGSADEFLHENIRQFFKVTEQTKSVLQELDIPMFASRLHHTLKDPGLGAGKPCVFDKAQFPSLPHDKSWLRELWAFFETQLKPKKTANSTNTGNDAKANEQSTEKKQHIKVEDTLDHMNKKRETDEKEIRQKAQEVLQAMHKWCLIPVKKMKKKESEEQQSQGIQMLYPLLDLHKVVHLSQSPDSSNRSLWEILKGLPLPFLDQLSPSNIACKLVASISHPRALLRALASCADSLSESHVHGCAILAYFSNNLEVLKESSASETELVNELRSLPVFPAINEKLVPVKQSVPVICLNSSVPPEGLSQWSQQRKFPLILLSADFVPSRLTKYLGFETVTDANFYAQYLLPSIHNLHRPAIASHMDFLRENFFRGCYTTDIMGDEQKQLLHQLKDTAFIEVDGVLHKANSFYSPDEPVFKVMCPEKFPPEPYNSMKWSGLMAASGMVCDITDRMFLSFARTVEQDMMAGVTNQVKEKSVTLVKHLFGRRNVAESGLLLNVCSIQFVLPLEWMSTDRGRQLQQIAPAFCKERLISFAESSFERYLNILWSSSCLMDPYCDPQSHGFSSKTLSKVVSQLGLQVKAPKGKVIQHARNLCSRLGGEEGRDIFTSLGSNNRLLIIVMEELYRYLDDHVKEHELSSLTELKIICDIDNSQMLRPANVVVDLRPHETIKGHIEKAPHHFGRYFDLFKKLGAVENVTANHYACVLLWLKTHSGNEQLNVEEMKIVAKAVEGLFRCLKEGTEEQKKIAVDALYLPTEDKNLQKSTELIFKDDYFGERFQTPPNGMYFMLGFETLKIKITFPQEDVKRLPREHRIMLMSEITHEVIPREILHSAEEADQTNPLASRLSHPGFRQAIIRLVYHAHKCSNQKFTEETARHVVQTLKNVSIKEVDELKTVITLFDSPVPGTEKSKVSFTEKIGGEHREAVVLMAAKAARNWSRHEESCVHSLAIAVKFVLRVEPDSRLLHLILQHPKGAKRILDENRIPQCTLASELDDDIFPSAGDFIPLHFHHHLNNSSFDFYKGEHVGFEVHDGLIDDNAQNGDTDPVFIYGIIVKEVHCQNAENAGRLNRRYLVDLGPGHGQKEVSVLRLYKFVRRSRDGTDQAVVPHQNSDTEPAESLPEMRTVLAEIRSLLTEAWQLPDEKDRKRVVKRLLLQWHPDKNPGNEEFCTRVTQTLLHYVKLLEEGKTLPADDGEGGGDAADDDFFTSSSFFSSHFFTNMRARGTRHRHHFDSERSRSRRGGGSSGSRGSGRRATRERNPQPGESSRWFRQAQADVSAAKATVGSHDRGHNWICCQCHQAVEKALKAVLFLRDADSFEVDSRDLPDLAKSAAKGRDPKLLELVRELEDRVGPYARMCYPDVMVYPRVPDDVYKRSDAEFACDVATQVLDRVQTLMRVQ
ncbi:sacsin-like [Babylonia areolata]|uniref:sacsin-like n=1 Tax=Babylonia areolata TaxID=304850 RepID=UPI003FD4978E